MNKNILYVTIALIVVLIVGYFAGSFKQNPNNQSNLKNNNASDTSQMDNVNDTNGMGQSNKMGQSQNFQPNRGNCLSDDCLMVDDLEYPVGDLPSDIQESLNKAIDDEYKALSTYEAVIEKFGMVRPFSMIKGAEEQHIASLKAVYDKYGLDVPENSWLGNVSAPETIQEACQIGVDAEIANAALYRDVLLPTVEEYEDITGVFTSLMNASQEKHLPAFERCN